MNLSSLCTKRYLLCWFCLSIGVLFARLPKALGTERSLRVVTRPAIDYPSQIPRPFVVIDDGAIGGPKNPLLAWPETLWVCELFDQGRQRSIKQIRLDEWLGETQDEGCRLLMERWLTRQRHVAEYEIRVPQYHLLLKRFVTYLDDPNMPGGQRVLVSFEAGSLLPEPLRVSLSVHFLHRGDVRREEPQGLLTLRRETQQTPDADPGPILVEHFSPEPQTLALEPLHPGDPSWILATVHWPSVDLTGSRIQGRRVLGFHHLGVTTLNTFYAHEQARYLVRYFAENLPEPQLAAEVVPDRWEIPPGDIVRYHVRWLNIGTSPVTGALLRVPIPSEMRYLPGSVSVSGIVWRFSTDGGKTYRTPFDQTTAVTHIEWHLQRPFMPGESLEMSFQAQPRETTAGTLTSAANPSPSEPLIETPVRLPILPPLPSPPRLTVQLEPKRLPAVSPHLILTSDEALIQASVTLPMDSTLPLQRKSDTLWACELPIPWRAPEGPYPLRIEITDEQERQWSLLTWAIVDHSIPPLRLEMVPEVVSPGETASLHATLLFDADSVWVDRRDGSQVELQRENRYEWSLDYPIPEDRSPGWYHVEVGARARGDTWTQRALIRYQVR